MTNYTFKDVERMVKGSDELHEMENDIQRFYSIIEGIILSKKFPRGTILLSHIDPISDRYSLSMKVSKDSTLEREILYLTTRYKSGSLPKEAVPIIFGSLPYILTILVKNKPELKKDFEFLISMAPKTT